MEFIQLLLSRPTVVSVSFTKTQVKIITVDHIAHNYSMDYFIENIVPKIQAAAK